MAKQSFSVGQVLTAAQMTSLQQTAMGGGSPVTKTSSYVLTAADAGTVIQVNSTSATTITVNTGLFSAGDSVQIQNIGAGVMTITAGTATVNSAGSLGVTQYDGGFLYFSSASSAIWFDYTQAGTTLPLTTKGDLFGYSTTNARIPVGADATVLTADSTQALGVKWAAPASGGAGNMAQIASGTLSGTSVSLTGLSSYTDLVLQVNSINVAGASNPKYTLGLNSNTGSTNYKQGGGVYIQTATYTWFYDSMASFFTTYQTNALRTGSNIIYLVKFTNCKNAGFTDIDMISYYTTASSLPAYEWSKGVYTVSEAVSSIQIKNDIAATFNQGSYTLWGA